MGNLCRIAVAGPCNWCIVSITGDYSRPVLAAKARFRLESRPWAAIRRYFAAILPESCSAARIDAVHALTRSP